MSAPAISLRPIAPGDEAFLFQVYASTRTQELAPLHWSAAQVNAFLEQQFHAQRRHYETYFGDADFLIILADGESAGRLYVARRADEIRVIDIALLPKFRKQGIGSQLPVLIHVEKMNPARRLYERLGFTVIGDEGVYWFMEKRPAARGKGAEDANNEAS